MPRYRLLSSMTASPGFGAASVCGAISARSGFCGETCGSSPPGTDTGVHARQVVHVDLEALAGRDGAEYAERLDAGRSPSLGPASPSDWRAVLGDRAALSLPDPHPRPPALDQGRVWHVKRPLDAAAMHGAAQALVGHHDFTTFRDLNCQAKSPLKTLDVARVTRQADEVVLEFEARSFLHRQVRSMTGTLAEVGIGRWTAADVADALAARDRKACGPVAPPGGLYLTGVTY